MERRHAGGLRATGRVLGVERAPAAGAASAVLGACMFGGGILVSPLLALGGGGAFTMGAVVAGGAIAALATTAILARPARTSRPGPCRGPGRRVPDRYAQVDQERRRHLR